jgi:hypothetical protein
MRRLRGIPQLLVRMKAGRRRSPVLLVALAVLVAPLAPVLTAAPAGAGPGGISTVAGGGVGDGDPARAGTLLGPTGMALAPNGDLFILDEGTYRIRKVSAATGIITTVVGTGLQGFSGDGGPATAASLTCPRGVTLDGAGRLYIGDACDDRIRRVDTNGIITTIAGTGSNAASPDGLPATSTNVSPTALAIDHSGNLLFADCLNPRIMRIGADGIVTTIAGGGSPADGLGDGGPATQAALGYCVQGIAVDAAGDVIISDESNNRLRKVDTGGIITTIAGLGDYNNSGDGGPAVNAGIGDPVGVTVDAAGNIDFVDGFPGSVRSIDPSGIIRTIAGPGTYGVTGDGGPATDAWVWGPKAVVAGPAGLFVSQDPYFGGATSNTVRKIDAAGIISTYAGGGFGDGGPATSARVVSPTGLRLAGGSMFVVERYGQKLRKVAANGVISTVAGGGQPGDGLGDNGPATAAALNTPVGVAVNGTADTVFIADCGNNRVRKVDPAGIITTFAGGGSPADGLGDGGQAKNAAFACPTGLLLVTAGSSPPIGTLFVADCDANRVRRIDPSGVVTTVAGTGAAGFNGDGRTGVLSQLSCPSDLAMDAKGGLLIADTDNNRVRRLSPTGVMSTVAGNGANGFGADGTSATSSPVNNPTGLAVESSGALVVVEHSHARIRQVGTDGKLSTLAGTGVPGYSGDGGPATTATLSNPTQVAVDAAGNVDFTDTLNFRVRQVVAGVPKPDRKGCGEVILHSTRLKHDVGPCTASDGLVIGADNVTVDLNGHQILGPGPGQGDGTRAGVRIADHKHVTVTGGTVSGFDGGVAIIGGSFNTVANLTVTHNVAPLLTSSGFESSEFGDGIVMMFSSNNSITHNVVDANGEYDGIGVLGANSNNNTISSNVVSNTVGDGMTNSANVGEGILVNPFLDFTLPGRGTSSVGNNILGNTVTGNYTDGISDVSNINATIAGNVSSGNGLVNAAPGNGIGVTKNRNAVNETNVVVTGNSTHGNGGNGIYIGTNGNHVTGNDGSGNVLGPDPYHQVFDLNDGTWDPNPPYGQDCTDNVWMGNVWGSGGYNPVCVTTGGHDSTGATAAPAAVSSTAAPAASRSKTAPTVPDAPESHRQLPAGDRALAGK